jgi:N-acetylmuramoyl-L-alanine amidase
MSAKVLQGWMDRRPSAIGRWLRFLAPVLVLGGVAAAGVSHPGPDAGILKVRVGGDAAQTRVVIELDRAVAGKLLSGEDPARQAVITLPRVDMSAGDMSGDGAGLVKNWRIDEAAGGARLRFDLARSAVVKRRFLLSPGDGIKTYRYVVDFSAEGAPAQRPGFAKAVVEEPVLPAAPSRRVVVIDAGHGGHDVGAEGASTHEKDLNLAAALALRDVLKATGRYHVVLTRDTDAFIPLEQRVKIARRANADLFISLHSDAGSDPSLHGATVYTLSDKGADRVARHVFDKESNWFIDVNLPSRDTAVNRILLDLKQRNNTNRSAVFANALLDKLNGKVDLLRHSHRDANYVVLLSPETPAVLLEMGFITNHGDEHALGSEPYRRRFMDGVAAAIDAYFLQDAKFAAQ